MNRTLWDLLCEKKSYDEMVSIFSSHYKRYFPIEIRHYLAEWYEHQVCTSPPIEDPQFYDYAVHFQNCLIDKIEKLAESINENESVDNAARKFRFFEASGRLRYFTAEDLLKHLCNIMEHERYLFTRSLGCNTIQKDLFEEEIKKYELNAVQIESSFSQLTNIFESLQCELFEAENYFSSIMDSSDYNVQQIAFNIRSSYMKEQLSQTRDELFRVMTSFIDGSQLIVNEIITNHIEVWKEHQKLFHGGAYIDLQIIQQWCETISKCLHTVNEKIVHINAFEQKLFEFDNNFVQNPNLPQFNETIQEIFLKLVAASLVIEEHPSQVIKIGNKIKISIRLLVGSDYHDKSFIPCVQAQIVSESRAREIMQRGKLQGRPTGELLHYSANMATNKSKHFCANFRNMQLKSIDRSTKRDVTDEKFAICFSTVLRFENLEIPLFILSLPIVVIVHVNQEPSALATIIWDSSFSKIDRQSFDTPNQVTWSEFSKAFNNMFKEEVGRGLSDENLHCIAEKLYDRDLEFPLRNFDSEIVIWADFCKKKIPGRDFTFWEWLYSALKLIKEGFSNYWRDGYIEGFISKESTGRKLKGQPKGTFLLRFSDSSKGAISIAYVLATNSIEHVIPSTLKDLMTRSLTDRLNDFHDLKVLYPNLEKKAVFKVDDKNTNFRFGEYIKPIWRLPSLYELNKKNYLQL